MTRKLAFFAAPEACRLARASLDVTQIRPSIMKAHTSTITTRVVDFDMTLAITGMLRKSTKAKNL